jgi:hypothetical protein
LGTALPPVPEIPEGADLRKLDLPLPEDIRSDIDRLIEEFSVTPTGLPKYLLILNQPEKAPYAFDGLWQMLAAAQLPNVRLLVTTAEPTFITDECVNYLMVKGYGTPRLKRDESDGFAISHRTVLYFDESVNEVKVKQPEMSMLLLEVTA